MRRRVRPVLDPARPPRDRIREARDITDRVDVVERRAKPLVDDDAVVHLGPRCLRELDVRNDPHADDREIALERLPVGRSRAREELAVAGQLLELRVQQDVDPLGAIELDQLVRELGRA